jgi:zinc transport system ATP-binding protein
VSNSKVNSAQQQILIQCKEITIENGGRALIERFNLTQCAGSITHLRGANGVGKSTLLKMIAGVRPLRNGIIERHISLQDVFYLPQLHSPDLHLPVSLAEVSRLNRSKQIPHSEQHFQWFPLGMQTRMWNSASGGEKMRALLARALTSNCQLLLLDEPFNHLDADASPQIIKSLIEFVAKTRSSVLIVAHDLIPQTYPKEIQFDFVELRAGK